MWLCTPLGPLSRDHHRSRTRLRVYLERIHDPGGARQPKTQCSTRRIMVFERRLYVDEPRTIIDRLDLHRGSSSPHFFDPAHQYIAVPPAIFEDVSSKLRSYGGKHRHFCCPERAAQSSVGL